MRTLLLISIFSAHAETRKYIIGMNTSSQNYHKLQTPTQTLFDARSQDGCAVYGFSQGTTSGGQLQQTELLRSLAFKKTFASHSRNYGDMKVLWLQSFGYV